MMIRFAMIHFLPYLISRPQVLFSTVSHSAPLTSGHHTESVSAVRGSPANGLVSFTNEVAQFVIQLVWILFGLVDRRNTDIECQVERSTAPSCSSVSIGNIGIEFLAQNGLGAKGIVPERCCPSEADLRVS